MKDCMFYHPLVSVIIPVYNAGSYIHESIISILEQDYDNIEIIVVNDGSTDNTEREILSISDERIKLITQENGGVAKARNTGIENITGEWVMFVDADDGLAAGIISGVIKALQQDTDCVLFHAYRCIDGKKYLRRSFPVGAECGDPLEHFFTFGYAYGTLWAKAFHRSLFYKNEFQFDTSLTVGEDRDAMYNLLSRCKKVQYFENAGQGGYFYRLTDKSVSHMYSSEMIKSYIRLCEKMGERYLGGNRKGIALQEYYNWNCNIQVKIVLNNIFHPDNPKFYVEKKFDLKQLLEDTLFKEPLEKADLNVFGITKRIVVLAIRRQWCFVLSVISRVRYGKLRAD